MCAGLEVGVVAQGTPESWAVEEVCILAVGRYSGQGLWLKLCSLSGVHCQDVSLIHAEPG